MQFLAILLISVGVGFHIDSVYAGVAVFGGLILLVEIANVLLNTYIAAHKIRNLLIREAIDAFIHKK